MRQYCIIALGLTDFAKNDTQKAPLFYYNNALTN